MDAQPVPAVTSRHVGIFGLGRLGLEVLEQLVARGFRRFSLADSRPVAAVDLHRSTILQPQDLGRPRAAAVAARLLGRSAELAVHVQPGPESGPGCQSRLPMARWMPSQMAMSSRCTVSR